MKSSGQSGEQIVSSGHVPTRGRLQVSRLHPVLPSVTASQTLVFGPSHDIGGQTEHSSKPTITMIESNEKQLT